MSDTQISKENAAKQFESLADWYMVDLEPDDEDELSAIDKSARRIKLAITKGLLEVVEETDKNGQPTLSVNQRLHKPIVSENGTSKIEMLKYPEVSGVHKSAIKGNKKDGDLERAYQFLGALSGEGVELIKSLKGADNSIAEALATFFLVS